MPACIRILGLALASVLLSASAVPTFAQARSSRAYPADDPDCDDSQMGQLTIDADQRGFALTSLEVCFDARREVELRQKLPVALGCPPNQSEFWLYKHDKIDGLEVECEVPLPRKGLQHNGQIELARIQDVLQDTGVTGLTLNLWVPLYGAASCIPEGQESSFTNGRECTYVLRGAPDEPSVVQFSFGYDGALLTRIASILGLLLLIPIALALWFRRRAMNASEDSKPGIVFAYRRFITWTMLGGILIWWAATDLLHADDFVTFLLAGAHLKDEVMATMLPWILVWIPPAIVYFLCLALSSPIHSLRGMNRTQTQAVSQSFWAIARFAIPLSLVMLGVAELFNSPRIGVLLLLASMFMGRFVNQKAAKSFGMELQALTSGELRDRAFAIAQKAGAKLNQVYVLPAERMRMANAFAHSGHNIFLTDYLLKNLSKREVDAIVGHEMAHLQKKHIRNRILILIAAVLVIIFLTIWAERSIPPNLPLGPILYGCFLLVWFFISRRNEFAADAGAVKLTGDAEAMITGLARLSRLNTMPIHWGKLDEKMLTHPSTLRRMAHLARVGGLSEARIPELLSQSVAPPTDVYPIPATALSAGKIFSTQYKTRQSWVIAWTMMLTAAIVPTAAALAIEHAHASGWARALAYVAGSLLTVAIYMILLNFLPMQGMRKLEARLRGKLERENASQEIRSGAFVSLAPDPGPRIYEGNWAWDLGFLAASNDGLSYCGEETRFTLRREQITRISRGPGPLGCFNNQSLYVTWRDDDGNERIFNLRPLRAHSMLEMARLTRLLGSELENWYRDIPLPAGSLLSLGNAETHEKDILGRPDFVQVTSFSPRALARGHQLVRIFLWDSFIAVGVAILFGFKFPMLDAIVPSSSTASLNASGGAVLYVLVTVWIVRAFVLWPYWRFREATPHPEPAIPSPAAAQQL
jgi:Zn-dependent protease with chaperone function